MCCTVMFQYKCGCIERVDFECPFSTDSITDSSSSNSPRSITHQTCSRPYRLHQQKLFSPETTIKTAITPFSRQEQLLPLRIKGSILPLPEFSGQEIAKPEKRNIGEATVTEIDDLCHDCWQREVQLTKQRDGDSAPSTTTKDGEEQQAILANTHILREKPVNELILPRPSVSLEAMSSADSFLED
ncbi:hypothetical protein F4678DRAFT_433834 [Xylaria arbuscula]|nr:hypothetical protein F4678DRAFT_433834 [Xylaria arbuscula]